MFRLSPASTSSSTASHNGNPDVEQLLIRKAYGALGPDGSLLIHGSLPDDHCNVAITLPPADLDDFLGRGRWTRPPTASGR
ncbi:hypothetical protein ACWGMA_40365 [Streptomyces asiaticus]